MIPVQIHFRVFDFFISLFHDMVMIPCEFCDFGQMHNIDDGYITSVVASALILYVWI